MIPLATALASLLLVACPARAEALPTTPPGSRLARPAGEVPPAVFASRGIPAEVVGPDTGEVRGRLLSLVVTGRASGNPGMPASLVIEGRLVRVGDSLPLGDELPAVRLAAVEHASWTARVEASDSPAWTVTIPLRLTTR